MARPFVVFQVTLAGCGIYEAGGISHALPPGSGFAAVVPSAHRYYRPDDVPEWTFFYMLIRHPYVVARIAERQRTLGSGAVLSLLESPFSESPLLDAAETVFAGEFADVFAEELALFAFLTAYERHVYYAHQPAAPAGEALRETVRHFVRERLARPADVSEIAAAHGMTRSRFSHYFKELTGEAPAHFMIRVRLEETARQLAQTDTGLAHIATATGFADANHLCKVFRRHYGLSPGTFRRQMR